MEKYEQLPQKVQEIKSGPQGKIYDKTSLTLQILHTYNHRSRK